MKERFDNPKFYDYVFYPKGAWSMVAPGVFALALGLIAFFVWPFVMHDTGATIWWARYIFLVMIPLGLLIMFIRLSQLKKLQIGIGSGGLYIRGGGVIQWAEIKKIDEPTRHKKYGMSIMIITYSPEERGEHVSRIAKVARHFLEQYDDAPEKIFIKKSGFLSIPLKDFYNILQEYHSKYRQ